MAEPSPPDATIATASTGSVDRSVQEQDIGKARTSNGDPLLEHTELQPIQTLSFRSSRSFSVAQSNRDHPTSHPSQTQKTSNFAGAVKKFWSRQISVTVPHNACRDHLALERTFLGYLRTSLALSMIGVTITQLFRLQHALDPNLVVGYYVVGKPLGCSCLGLAIVVTLSGSFRCWRQQNAMVRQKALVGGWELKLIGTLITLLLLCLFIMLVLVDVSKSNKH